MCGSIGALLSVALRVLRRAPEDGDFSLFPFAHVGAYLLTVLSHS